MYQMALEISRNGHNKTDAELVTITLNSIYLDMMG